MALFDESRTPLFFVQSLRDRVDSSIYRLSNFSDRRRLFDGPSDASEPLVQIVGRNPIFFTAIIDLGGERCS
jgi:hypothetical protein